MVDPGVVYGLRVKTDSGHSELKVSLHQTTKISFSKRRFLEPTLLRVPCPWEELVLMDGFRLKSETLSGLKSSFVILSVCNHQLY